MTDTSLTSLQQQCEYKLDVDVRKGANITGGFGKRIYKAEWINQRDSPVVLLEMKGEKAIKEAMLYITLHHPYIIQTFGFVSPNVQTRNSESILLLQEYAEDGDLAGMLSNKYFIPSQSVLIELFIQVSDAMIYLSKHHIIHGDLACRNVLVFKSDPFKPNKNLVKLIDFGLTQDDSISLNVQLEIPDRYVAPEIIRSKGHSGYSEKSDVYSFAVFMWEACSFGKIPYEHISDDKEVCRQKLKGEKLTKPEKCDSNTWKLMILCWNDRPEARSTFQMIHTQLKTIQNTNTPNSNLSSSPSIIEDNPRLFNTEFETCQECGLRYTDYQSHQNTCSEEKLICYICQNQFRRAIYDNHLETCGAASENTINIQPRSPASSSDEMEEDDLSSCRFCNIPCNTFEREDHEETCGDNPRNRQKKISLSRSIVTSSKNLNPTSVRSPPRTQSPERVGSYRNGDHSDSYHPSLSSNRSSLNKLPQSSRHVGPSEETRSSSYRVPNHRESTKSVEPTRQKISEHRLKSNTIQLPCEICKKLFDNSELKTHQTECNKKETERIDRKRREIEQQKTLAEEAECIYCKHNCFLSELDNHQDNCRYNPVNVSDPPSRLDRTLSISVPDVRLPSIFDKSSTSSDDKLPKLNNNNQRISTPVVGHQKSKDEKTKTPTKPIKKEPSAIRKLFSRIWSFKKK